MYSKKISSVAFVFSLFLTWGWPTVVAAQTQTGAQRPAPNPASNVVACKALETHASAQPGVTVVLFHQRDKKDQPRFASLLKQADGSTVDIRVGRGDWQTVAVARLRMCFGRGLLVFPTGTVKLRDKEEFGARFGTKTAQQ